MKDDRPPTHFLHPSSFIPYPFARAAAAVPSYRRRRADRRRENIAGEPAGEAVSRDEDSRGRRQPLSRRVLQRQTRRGLPLPALLPALALRPATDDRAARSLHR